MDFSTGFGSTNIEDCSALKKDEKEKVEDFNNIDSSIKINFDEGDDIISEDNNKQPEKEKEINILTIKKFLYFSSSNCFDLFFLKNIILVDTINNSA